MKNLEHYRDSGEWIRSHALNTKVAASVNGRTVEAFIGSKRARDLGFDRT